MKPQAGTPEVGLACESRAMRRFATELENAAASDVPVLIWGEPGVGKERAARALRERLASFEAQLNDEPAQVHARLRLKTRLDLAEEELRV